MDHLRAILLRALSVAVWDAWLSTGKVSNLRVFHDLNKVADRMVRHAGAA